MIDIGKDDLRPGGPLILPASAYEDAVAAIRRRLAMRPVPPLMQSGSAWMLSRPEPFWATLSGASSPYSWSGASGASGGAWSAYPGAGAANAYEANGVAGLNGKRAFLRPGAAGDYRFQWVASGGGEGPGPGCGCFAEADIPPTLSWTFLSKRYDDFSASAITLGTTSGTLTYTSDVTFGSCSLGPGWVGDFEYWTEGVPPDTGISALKLNHCSNLRPGGTAGTLRCLFLAVLCTPVAATAGFGADGSVGIGTTSNVVYGATLAGDPGCYTYNAGVADLDGWAGYYLGSPEGGPRAAVALSELCDAGVINVAYPDAFGAYNPTTGYNAWLSYSLLTISV